MDRDAAEVVDEVVDADPLADPLADVVEVVDLDATSLSTPLTHDDIDRLVEGLPDDVTLTPVAEEGVLDDY